MCFRLLTSRFERIRSPAPEWARSEHWTPEQQAQELKRRIGIRIGVMFGAEIKFSPRPTDVIVATPPKCGTTWVAHICNQLRMRGCEPDFDAIEDVVPHLEVLGESVEALIQPAAPRIFATHKAHGLVPRGGKIIVCFRDPIDVIYSAILFLDSQMLLKGRVAMPLLCMSVIDKWKVFYPSLLYWWEHRNDEDALLLFFDDLKEDHSGSVRRIAKFIGVDCSEEEIGRVVHTTTHAEMVRHYSRFDNHNFVRALSNIIGDVPQSEVVGRIRKGGGKSGEGGEFLPQEFKQEIIKLWQEFVETKLGFKDMNEMRLAWKKEKLDKKV